MLLGVPGILLDTEFHILRVEVEEAAEGHGEIGFDLVQLLPFPELGFAFGSETALLGLFALALKIGIPIDGAPGIGCLILIDSYLGLMHTLFTLEDRYGLTIETRDGEVLFHFDPRKGQDAARISEMVYAWAPVMEKYRIGEITKEEYDNWRYNYPRDDKTQIWAHVPSAGLMDSIIEDMKK
jgi:hypothetical protein